MVPRPELIQVLSHATAFVCPSIYEPFGLVNLEAMACEAAVVASAVGGIPEIVVDGKTGYLVPCDPTAVASDATAARHFEATLAERINQLVADLDLATRLGTAGRRRVLERFTWEQVALRTVEVYRQAIAAHAAGNS
jgi:starch synthase